MRLFSLFCLPLYAHLLGICIVVNFMSVALAFEVNTSPQPANHHPIVPEQGTSVTLNPPSMVWREDTRAKSYIVELSQNEKFPQEDSLIRITDVAFPFYNHNEILKKGTWYWRYFVVLENGKISAPSPVRSFTVAENAQPFPIPSPLEILDQLPEHPRIFVTPETLEAFRNKRHVEGKEAWEALRFRANRALRATFETRGRRIPLTEAQIVPSAESIGHSDYKAGQTVRRQVFYKDPAGELFWLPDNHINFLKGDASRLETLSFAWQLSQDKRYLEGARKLIAMLAPLRLDAHLSDDERAEHDTVVYAYENGLKSMAIAYDRLYHELTEDERAAMLAHIEFHTEAAGNWLKKETIHTTYQISHPQQTMHALLVTVLATGGDSEIIDKWVQYVVPQYMNRIAWTSEDGGYFEGHAYAYKFGSILEALAAIRSATGVDLFKKPEIRNAGTYWLYAMDMNYWFNHWGDNMSLIWPNANARDAFTSSFLAAMNDDPYLKWYSLTTTTNPEISPFDYIAAGTLEARPPIDIPQARAFPLTGTLAAYNGLYDHSSERIFFRSSPWGAHSHAHADQNAFVIHAGGEVLAPDTGYYTYYGDDYHMKWSKATFAHNSMLVNGRPQPISIDSKGQIENFFHALRLTYFVGDASRAYEEPLETFRRAVLYVRPGTYIVYDELAATRPSIYSWLLNVFQKPEIDAEAKRILVQQQQMRLQVDTLLPLAARYSASNTRPYPIKHPDKPWSRFNGAFPQPWHIRVENATPAEDEAFLSLLQTWNVADGAREQPGTTVATPSTVGLTYHSTSESATVLFRRKLDGSETISTPPAKETGAKAAEALEADAQAAALFRSTNGILTSWLVARGEHLKLGNATLFRSEQPVNASTRFDFAAAAALIRISGAPGETEIRLPSKPQQLLAVPLGGKPQASSPIPFNWDAANSSVRFSLNEDVDLSIWVDPHPLASAPLPQGELRISTHAGNDPQAQDNGESTIALEPAWTEDGEIIYFARVSPSQIGTYTISAQTEGAATAAGANGNAAAPASEVTTPASEVDMPASNAAAQASEDAAPISEVAATASEVAESVAVASSAAPFLLVQDHWSPTTRSTRGEGEINALLRDGSFLYFKTRPGATNRFSAVLSEPLPKGQIDNLLFNGDFEYGIPDYPPRHWTVNFKLVGKDSLSWYHWTQEDARSGKSAVRYVRDHDNYELVSRSLRLQNAGEYHLRFYAKGNIDNAHVIVRGSQNRTLRVNIKPSEDWQLYEAKGTLAAGYTVVAIVTPDGPKGEELWVDDVQLGQIPNP